MSASGKIQASHARNVRIQKGRSICSMNDRFVVMESGCLSGSPLYYPDVTATQGISECYLVEMFMVAYCQFVLYATYQLVATPPAESKEASLGELEDEVQEENVDLERDSVAVNEDDDVDVDMKTPAPQDEILMSCGDETSIPVEERKTKLVTLNKSPPPAPLGKKKLAAMGKIPVPPSPEALNRQGNGISRHPELIAMYQDICRAQVNTELRATKSTRRCAGAGSSNSGSSAEALFQEMTKMSAYAKAVNADTVEYAQRISEMTKNICAFKPKGMQDVLKFVEDIDRVLDQLVDEHAVLKTFKSWPKRFSVLREAKALFQEFEGMKSGFQNWRKHPARSNTAEMAEIQKFMDKSIKRYDDIMLVEADTSRKFKEAGVPWNSKIPLSMKQSSLGLLEEYMVLALEEAARIQRRPMRRNKYREEVVQKHLNGIICFCFKVHQFAGGLNEACETHLRKVMALRDGI